MTGTEGFFQGLRDLGYEVGNVESAPGGGTISYTVPVGPRLGEIIELGFFPPGDWPITTPGGPYVKPHLLPINPDQTHGHPTGGVHPAPQLGPEWQYWSRPLVGWPGHGSVSEYLAHIRHLFATL